MAGNIEATLAPHRRLTYRVELPGGQLRLRQMILDVSERCRTAARFGRVKLNKVIWKADFDAFAMRRVPVTGRAYQRLKWGPAAIETQPLYSEMLQDGLIHVEKVDLGDGFVEQRTIADISPELTLFSADDLSYVDVAIRYYWEKTGREASDDLHGVAWRTREDGDPMPYELALLSDRQLEDAQAVQLLDLVERSGWSSA